MILKYSIIEISVCHMVKAWHSREEKHAGRPCAQHTCWQSIWLGSLPPLKSAVIW